MGEVPASFIPKGLKRWRKESNEDYQRRLSAHEAKLFDSFAWALANGELVTLPQIKDMARKLGCSEVDIESWKRSREVNKQVIERIKTRAVQGVAEALGGQAELAKSSTGAFRVLAQVADVLPAGGVNVQTNVLVDGRTKGWQDAGHIAFSQTFRDRQALTLERRLAAGTPVEEAK